MNSTSMCLLNWIWDVATCTQSHIIKVGGQSWGRTCYPPAHLFETLTSRGIACGSSLSHRAFDCIFCVSRLCHQLVKLAMLELVFRKRLSSSFFLDSSQLEQSQKDFVEHGDTDDPARDHFFDVTSEVVVDDVCVFSSPRSLYLFNIYLARLYSLFCSF